MTKNIGLYFGSFNPIHIGHLIVANTMLQNTSIEEVWFVVSPQNPFKDNKDLLDENSRLEILNTAIADNKKFVACNIEFNLPKPSYTIHTLIELKSQYPQYVFSIIMGSDNLEEIDKWKDYQAILNNYTIYVYMRPNYPAKQFLTHKSIKQVEAPLLQISSTYIRQQIANQKSVQYLLPKETYNYITQKGFYKN